MVGASVTGGTGETTAVVITTSVSGNPFLTSADVVIGSTTVVRANVNAVSNSGATTTVTITSAVGQLFDTAADRRNFKL